MRVSLRTRISREKGEGSKKHQRILSLLLTGVLTCALLWTPACAAPGPAVMKEVENGIVVTVRDRKPLETTIDVCLRDWSLLDDGETFVLGQPGGKETIPVLKLPLSRPQGRPFVQVKKSRLRHVHRSLLLRRLGLAPAHSAAHPA